MQYNFAQNPIQLSQECDDGRNCSFCGEASFERPAIEWTDILTKKQENKIVHCTVINMDQFFFCIVSSLVNRKTRKKNCTPYSVQRETTLWIFLQCVQPNVSYVLSWNGSYKECQSIQFWRPSKRPTKDQDFITFQIRFSGIYELWVENVTVNVNATFSILKQIACIKNDNVPCKFWSLKGWVSSLSILDFIGTFVRLNICTIQLHSFYYSIILLFQKTTNIVQCS